MFLKFFLGARIFYSKSLRLMLLLLLRVSTDPTYLEVIALFLI